MRGGADGETRTPTGFRPLEPESSVSTNSTTSACSAIIPQAGGCVSRGWGKCANTSFTPAPAPYPLPALEKSRRTACRTAPQRAQHDTRPRWNLPISVCILGMGWRVGRRMGVVWRWVFRVRDRFDVCSVVGQYSVRMVASGLASCQRGVDPLHGAYAPNRDLSPATGDAGRQYLDSGGTP